MTDHESMEVALARFEGKLDAWSMQQARHEERLQSHSTKIDALRDQVTEVATKVASQQEAKRSSPSWPTIASAVVAIAMAVLFVAQQIYGG